MKQAFLCYPKDQLLKERLREREWQLKEYHACRRERIDIMAGMVKELTGKVPSPKLSARIKLVLKEHFEQHWDVLGKHLMALAGSFTASASLPTSVKDDVTILLHKKGAKDQLENYRPTILLNFRYKVLARVLASRIKKVLHKGVVRIHTREAGFRGTLPHPALPVALPCWPPRRPDGRRAALCSPPRHPLQPARRHLQPARHHLQPARRPLQPARHPAAARHALPASRPAGPGAVLCSSRLTLLQPAAPPFAARGPPLAARTPPFAPARRPAAALPAAHNPAAAHPAAHSPASQQPAARTAQLRATLLLAPPGCYPPCCAQPCWPVPSCRRSALLPTRRPVGTRTALPFHARSSSAQVRSRRPACVPPCWSRTALLCPLWLLSVYSHSIMRAWLTRDAAARLAVRNHLPLAECANFGQHKTAKALYDAVVARYSSPATAALGRLTLPYLFPELSAFATVEDLVTHSRTSNAHYRAALPADQGPLDPTDLTVDLLEKHLLPAETSIVAVGAARGTPRTPFFEGCSPSPLAPSYASAAAVDILGVEDIAAASALSGKCRSSKSKGGKSGGGGSGGGGGGGSGGGGGGGSGGSGGSGGGSGGFGDGGGGSGGVGGGGGGGRGSGGSGSGGGRGGAVQRGGSGGGQRQQLLQRRSQTPTPQQLREWFPQRGASGGSVHYPYSKLLRSKVDIFALDYDAIIAAMYALSVSAEGDCYLCVPPDPDIEAAALGASDSALPGTARAEALHTFTLDSGASRCFFCDSTTLTPLPAPIPVRLADPSGGPALARSSTVLPCSSVPSGSL
ncbi:unnamed protein product [Closterium sp. NIES-54]